MHPKAPKAKFRPVYSVIRNALHPIVPCPPEHSEGPEAEGRAYDTW